MDRYACIQCKEEFFLKNGCSCCSPLPGPYFCPECGGRLQRIASSYVCSGYFDEE